MGSEAAHNVPVSTRNTGIKLWFQQCRSLLTKNAILAWRNRWSTVLQLVSSLFFIFLIWLIDQAITARIGRNTNFKNLFAPEAVSVEGIPKCESGYYIKKPCKDFIWSGPANLKVIVDNIRNNNPGYVIPESKVLRFETEADVNAYLRDPSNAQRVPMAVNFYVEGENISYGIQINGTAKSERGEYEDINFKYQVPLQVAVEREVVRYYLTGTNRTLQWTPAFSEYAHPNINSFSAVGTVGPTFLFAASMFSFVLQISNLVVEKENKLRQAMQTMGLLDSAYWASWLIWEAGLAFIYSILLIIFGMIFQFRFFLENDFGVLFFLFFLFQFNMTGLAFMVSTFLSKVAAATTIGFAIFLVGFFTQLIVVFGFPYDKSIDDYWWIIFSIFPPDLLAIGLKYLGDATATKEDPGIRWSKRGECSPNNDTGRFRCVLTMEGIYSWLISTFFLWLVLALYFDNVFPDVNGVRKNPWYFLMPSYWTGARAGTKVTRASGADVVPDDEDVVREMNLVKEQAVKGLEPGSNIAIQVQGLQKWFGGGLTCTGCCCCSWKEPFQAVKGSYFNIEQDKLFCLLGPNGAGKTTTFNCLTGIIPVTSGDAHVYGESVTSTASMARIRRYMGVCPQFDILWPELNGREHLSLFANIKGLPPNQVKEETEDLLTKVKLTEAGSVRTGSYSGGMKRRLSVAVALIGDPKVVYLDEPTTGMDPISRRYVWDIIEASKKGRAIVLTTHSMEEADILGDRIAIMAKGMLRCIGTSIHLKNKFGAGYIVSCGFRSSVNVQAGGAHDQAEADAQAMKRVAALKALFKQELGIEPSSEDKSYLKFQVPRSLEPRLAGFFKTLNQRKAELGITDVQLSLSTLEEVFLSIAKQAELEAAKTEGRFETVTLSTGMAIRVPIGAQFVGIPGSQTAANPNGDMIEVHWSQDDTGTLRVSWHSEPMAIPDEATSSVADAGRSRSGRLSFNAVRV